MSLKLEFERYEKLVRFAKAGSLKKVTKLVEAGADIKANNYKAYRYAVRNKHVEIVKYLEEKILEHIRKLKDVKYHV